MRVLPPMEFKRGCLGLRIPTTELPAYMPTVLVLDDGLFGWIASWMVGLVPPPSSTVSCRWWWPRRQYRESYACKVPRIFSITISNLGLIRIRDPVSSLNT